MKSLLEKNMKNLFHRHIFWYISILSDGVGGGGCGSWRDPVVIFCTLYLHALVYDLSIFLESTVLFAYVLLASHSIISQHSSPIQGPYEQ